MDLLNTERKAHSRLGLMIMKRPDYWALYRNRQLTIENRTPACNLSGAETAKSYDGFLHPRKTALVPVLVCAAVSYTPPPAG